MIDQILLALTVIIIYEFISLIKFKIILKFNLKIYQKIFLLFRLKRVSDFRKEKLILRYSNLLFLISVKILAIILVIIIFMFVMTLISRTYFNLIISIIGILEISLFFIVYYFIRKKIS